MTVIPWEAISTKEISEPLVDLADYRIICEPAYFNMGLSLDSTIFVRQSVAEKLVNVNARLGENKLKVWDGYRSREVQLTIYQKLWNETKAKQPEWNDDQLTIAVNRFVTPLDNPVLPHMTGGAVDLTLIDANGVELDMGTGFDDFTPHAATFSQDIPKQVQQNRTLLLEAMAAEGFTNYPEEWWHFGYGDPLSAYLNSEDIAIYGEIEKPSY